MADVLVIIDMQVGSFGPASPRHDADALIGRLNGLAEWVRSRDGVIVWVQHDGPPGDAHEPGSEGWHLLPALDRRAGDPLVRKTACDSFLGTNLEGLIRAVPERRVIIAGCATDFCVDTTIRSSTGKGFKTLAASDGHTTADRPHLSAAQIIAHHNYVWSDLIAPGGAVTVMSCQQIMTGALGRS